MLVLTRRENESIMVGDQVEIRVLEVRERRVRLGIIAPRSIQVHRKEVFLAIRRENEAAAQADHEAAEQLVERALRGNGDGS